MNPHQTLVALPLALALGLAGTAPAFANPVQEADAALLRTINQAHSPAGDVAYRVFSNNALLLGVPVATGYAVSGGNWGLSVRALEAELLAAGLAGASKYAFHRPRPFVTYPDTRLPWGPEILDSFPSGHAMISFAGATAIAVEQPAWAVPAYTWATLVCYSRVYGGVHYPTDVLGGAALGVGSAFLASWLFSGLNARLGVPGANAGGVPVMPLTWSSGF